MRFLKKILAWMATNKITWFVMRPMVSAFLFMDEVHKSNVLQLSTRQDLVGLEQRNILESIFEDKTVRHGPFSGLKYPLLSAHGSVIWAKLMGSYEMELHPIVERILLSDYKRIVNIGSGEGYYAVGLALKMKNAKVYAYDIQPNAVDACQAMSILNKTENRVECRGGFEKSNLIDFNFDGSDLIICDCEGCEGYMFTPETINFIAKCDLLIETHDFIDFGITERLVSLFRETHQIQLIKSIDDLEKAMTYNFPETQNLTLALKRRVYREGRPGLMYWLFLEHK